MKEIIIDNEFYVQYYECEGDSTRFICYISRIDTYFQAKGTIENIEHKAKSIWKMHQEYQQEFISEFNKTI